jgi:sugar phosphate isomerase/epimerase
MAAYRLGATSFVYPAGWLENVQRLVREAQVRDVELLFFDIEGPGGLPSGAELAGLARCRREHDLTYCLHTPLAASLASSDESRRRAGVLSVLSAIRAAAELEPENIVLHVYLGDRERDVRPRDLPAWRARAARSFEELAAAGVALSRCCVELIDYDLRLLDEVLLRFELGVALDVGHLHRDGQALAELVGHFLPRTRVVQWHGTDASGRDHRSLAHVPREQARWLLSTLHDAGYRGVLTLEVFRPEDFRESLELVRVLQAELETGARPGESGPRDGRGELGV